MKINYRLRHSLLAAASSLLAVSSSHAADGTWNIDTTNGLWSLNTNWLSNTIADGSGSTANFTNNITGDRTVRLDTDRTLTNLVFGDSNTSSAGSWLLDNNGVSTNNLILAGTTPGIAVNALGAGKTATISAIIQGTAGLVKTGTGTLILSAANTYSGTTTINAGTLQIGNGTNTTAAVTGTKTLNGGTLNYNYNSGLSFVPGNITLSADSTIGSISSNNSQMNFNGGTLNGAGFTLTINNGANTAPLYFNQTFGSALGQINITAGSVGEDGNHGTPLRTAPITVSSGAGFRTFATVSINNNFTLNGGSGTGSNGAIFNEGGGVATYTGTVNLASGTSSIGTNGGNIIMSGVLSGTGALTKISVNTLTLSNANTYTGNTRVNGGNIALGNALALQNSAYDTASVNGGLNVTGFATPTLGGLTGSVNLTSTLITGYGSISTLTLNPQTGITNTYSGDVGNGNGSMALTMTGAGTQVLTGTNTYTGGTRVDNGILALGHATNTLANTGAINVNGGTLALGTNTDTVGAVTLTSGSITGSGAGRLTGTSYGVQSGTISAKLGGSGALTKTTAGTVTISSDNSGGGGYTGAIAVNAGTLIVNGNVSTSITTVASGGTISGSGTTGALTVQTGGFINPGNSPGILSTGNYTQLGLYTAEINGLTAGTQHDQINVTGTVDITGGSLATLFTGSYALNDMIFILLNDGLDTITGTFAGLDQGATAATYGGFDWKISYQGNSGGSPSFLGGNDIVLQAIPEPGAALLGGIGVLMLLRRRRK